MRAMPLCPHTDGCALTRTVAMEAALRVWRSFYCEGSHQRCERYKLALAGADVPSGLLPNGRLVDGPNGGGSLPGGETVSRR